MGEQQYGGGGGKGGEGTRTLRLLRASFLLLTCLIASRLLAPEAEFWAYALMAALGVASGLLWSSGPGGHHLLPARVAAASLLSLAALWLLFYLTGGKVFWTEAMALSYFALLVLPLTAVTFLATRERTPANDSANDFANVSSGGGGRESRYGGKRGEAAAVLAMLAVLAALFAAGLALSLASWRAREARSYVVSARSDGFVEGVRLVGTPRAELHRRFGEPLRVESIDGTTIDLLDRAYMRVVYSSGGVARHASVDFAEHRRDVGGRLTVRLEHHGRTVPLNRDATEAEVVAAWPDAEPVDMSHLYTPEWRRNYPPGITRRWLRDSGVLVTFQDGKATELSFPALNLY